MRRIYITFFTFIMITIVLTGCSRKETTNNSKKVSTESTSEDINRYNYTFKGENKEWKAVYKTDATMTWFKKKDKLLDYTSKANNIMKITYKGKLKNLSDVKHFDIGYKTNSEGCTRSEDCDSRGITSRTFTFTSESIIYNKDEVIKIMINLDGKKQSFKLKNVEKQIGNKDK